MATNKNSPMQPEDLMRLSHDAQCVRVAAHQTTMLFKSIGDDLIACGLVPSDIGSIEVSLINLESLALDLSVRMRSLAGADAAENLPAQHLHLH